LITRFLRKFRFESFQRVPTLRPFASGWPSGGQSFATLRYKYIIRIFAHLFAMLLRNAADSDLEAVQAIYAYWVTHGTGSFELDPPSVEEMGKRRADVLSRGLPYLIAEDGGKVCGYAYANWFRPRPAYRFSVENSVYVHPDLRRGGVARLLMAELMTRCEQAGSRQMVAVIGDSANAGSIGLHTAMGFRHIGVLQSTGWKFGRWLDTVYMQRELGLGDASAPASL
jgi:L-amino acid N-acyltransferase YncA